MLFKDLKKNLIKDFSGRKIRRLAILGDSATQFLTMAIKGYGYEEGINYDVFEADYDQLDTQIFDSASDLYSSNPDFVILYLSSEKLWKRYTTLHSDQKSELAEQIIAELKNWWETLFNNCNARIIQFNFAEFNDGVFGHYANLTKSSFLFQLRKLNSGLMILAQQYKQVFIADIASIVNQYGYKNAHDPRLYVTSKVAFALDFLPVVAKVVTDIVKAITGNFKKCLILDLDNTLWGGVIGDDGVENIQIGDLGMGHAFDALQMWAKELKQRGIILAVCSKNEMDTAKKPFFDHPDMILKYDDIAVFIANWDNKADNIKLIQSMLNIGFDSMVFVDDNPFERNLVRQHLPEVTVPEMPEDPSCYVSYLQSLNLFETASFSEEDKKRTKQYQQEIARTSLQKTFTNINDYLKSLKMVSTVRPFDNFNTPRVAQLTQRSNQFNLRTVRYTEADIKAIRQSDKYLTLAFNLEDRFGDHGLIALIILKLEQDKTAFVDTWIMSCRVLKRGMEEFTLNQMVKQVRCSGIEKIIGEYLPTPKNMMVKELYSQLGFKPVGEKWELDVSEHEEFSVFIKPVLDFPV